MHPVSVDGVRAEGTRFLQTGPRFFSTMQIPILQGREIDERDRAGALPVVVISDQFAKTFFANQNPLGRHIKVGGSAGPLDAEVIGVAAAARYGPLKITNPPVIYVSYLQLPAAQVRQMTYALRTDGDPLRHAATIRQIVRDADSRIPITSLTTQAAEIDQTINQEIVLAQAVHSVCGPGAAHRFGRTLRHDGVRRGAAHARDRHPDGAGRAPNRGDVDGDARSLDPHGAGAGDQHPARARHVAIHHVVPVRDDSRTIRERSRSP